MERQDHQTKINQRVRLKSDGPDALYPMAYAGSEGWVRRQDKDALGYPMVYIEWDREHWADNGEPNKWAMEAHFEPVEGDQMSEEEFFESNPDFQKFMQSMYERYKAEQGEKTDPAPVEEEDPKKLYEQALERAMAVAKENGEAFILIVAHKTEAEDNIPIYVPRVYNFYASKEGGLAAEMVLPSIVEQTVHELGMDALARAADEGSDES